MNAKTSPLQSLLTLRGLALPLLLIMAFVMGLQNCFSPDLGFHLRSAQWVLEHKAFIYTDEFSFGSAGNNYYDLQWLYQLIIYACYKAGQEPFLVILNSLLLVCSFVLVWLRFKQKISSALNISAFTILAIFGAQALSFEIRPQVFSFIYLNILLIILENYKQGKTKKLFWLPFIMLLWVNTHSLAILGLVIIGAYLAGSYFETKKLDKTLLKFVGLSLFAFLINPYFINGLLFPLSQFGILKGDAFHKTFIGELQSPFTFKDLKEQGLSYIFNPLFYIQVYSLISVLACINSFRKKNITDAFLIAGFFVLLFLAIKNYGFYLMVTLPMTAAFVHQWLEGRNKSIKPDKKKMPVVIESKLNKRMLVASIVFAVFISWICVTDGFSVLHRSPFRFGISQDKETLPIEATEFLNKNKIYGKILNDLDFGGYLMYHYPEKNFIDGRLELPKPDLLKKYYGSLKSQNLNELISEYNPDIVLFPYMKNGSWWVHLISDKTFRLVYFDGLAAIYIKQGKFENIPELTAVSVNQMSGNDEKGNIAQLIQEEKSSRMTVAIKSIWQKQYFPLTEQNKANFCFTMGFMDAGLNYCGQALRKATVSPANVYYLLSIYLKDAGQYRESEDCLKKSKRN